MEVFDGISDDDGDFMEYLEYERRPYIVRARNNPFDDFDELEFFSRFRLKKETVLYLLEQIELDIEFPTDRNHSISPINLLLLTLRYYATGSFLMTVGDSINVSKSTAGNIVKRVSNALAHLSPRYLKMPENPEEIVETLTKFYEIARMPRTIGSLDCTHIKIMSPGGNNAEVFRNRKSYFSINVQTVSNTDLKITDFVARWPGSVHDQTIFNNSSIKQRLENGEFGNLVLVADSGYSNTKHIITPLLETHNEVEELYNESDKFHFLFLSRQDTKEYLVIIEKLLFLVRRTRNPVERQYGVLKRRFPVLSVGLRSKVENSLAVIVACAVLHNIAIEHREEIPPEELNNVDYDEDIVVEPPEQNNLLTARDVLLQNYFPTLV